MIRQVVSASLSAAPAEDCGRRAVVDPRDGNRSRFRPRQPGGRDVGVYPMRTRASKCDSAGEYSVGEHLGAMRRIGPQTRCPRDHRRATAHQCAIRTRSVSAGRGTHVPGGAVDAGSHEAVQPPRHRAKLLSSRSRLIPRSRSRPAQPLQARATRPLVSVLRRVRTSGPRPPTNLRFSRFTPRVVSHSVKPIASKPAHPTGSRTESSQGTDPAATENQRCTPYQALGNAPHPPTLLLWRATAALAALAVAAVAAPPAARAAPSTETIWMKWTRSGWPDAYVPLSATPGGAGWY